MPLTLLQLEHKSKTEPFLEGKDLTIHYGARFPFCGCCFQSRHCKARRGEGTARSRFAHPGTWASQLLQARSESQPGCPGTDGSKNRGLSGQAGVTPSPRRAVRAPRPQGPEGLPGRRTLPEPYPGPPGRLPRPSSPGRGARHFVRFFVWLFGCSELKAAPARLAGAGEAPGRACAGCSGPRSALRTHRRPTHTHRALRILPPNTQSSAAPHLSRSHCHPVPVPAPVPNPAPFPLRVSPRGASSSPGARPARPAAEPRPWRSRAGALRAPAGV